MQSQLLGVLGRRLARDTGLSESDYAILLALDEAPDHVLRALALRCTVHWEKSRLSHHLRRMEERGLLQRGECVEDGRGALVRLTNDGARALDAAAAARLAHVHTYVLDVLTPDQLTALDEISAALLDRLAQDEQCRTATDLLTQDEKDQTATAAEVSAVS